MSVFVSYGRADAAAYVDRLADHLATCGVAVWRDVTGVEYGQRWEQEIGGQVDACAVMVVVMTPAAEASLHVANELDRARRRGKPILPLLLAGEPLFAVGPLLHDDVRHGGMPTERFVRRVVELAGGAASAGPELVAVRARQTVVGDLPAAATAFQDRPGPLAAVVAIPALRTGQREVTCTRGVIDGGRTAQLADL